MLQAKVVPPATSCPRWLPAFESCGCCLGLVMRFFLRYEDPAEDSSSNSNQQQQQQRLETFEAEARAAYPSAVDPVRDLCLSLRLWGVLEGVVRTLHQSVDVSELLQEFEIADALLSRQLSRTGLRGHPAFPGLSAGNANNL